MTRIVRGVCTAVLLAGPFALAKFEGGYFQQPRLIAAIVAWALVAIVAVTTPRPLPRSRAGLIALAGMAGLVVWTAVSVTWAPLRGPAFEDFQRLLLYLAALLLAVPLLRARGAATAVEPTFALGALAVILYGLSERLLPGVIHLPRSLSAGGRLEQPLTYWNAMGLMAAIGFVLCARLAGDPDRDEPMRLAAAAASVPLGVGIYLSFSRAAIAAVVVGLVVLLLLAPTRVQLRAVAIQLALALPACVLSGALSAVRTLGGSAGSRETQGAVMFAGLVLACGVAAYAQRRLVSGVAATPIQLPRRAPVYAAITVLVLAAGALAAGLHEHHQASAPAFGAKVQRLGSVESNRYDYWAVAFRSFGREPLRGGGSSSFRVDWLRERHIRDPALDAHSLYIETAAELGLVGLALLAALLGGIAVAARSAYRRAPALTSGWIAALSVWALHAGLDWDWEMPAVSLLALILGGALIAWADPRAEQAAVTREAPAEAAVPAGSGRS